MRYTIAVTSISTTTGSMTVEAASPEEAQEQVETAIEKAWRHASHDWQAGIDLLDDAQTETPCGIASPASSVTLWPSLKSRRTTSVPSNTSSAITT
jgi:hypothetical protein